jgi:hypothetical protein
MGLICLVRRNGADTFERGGAVALFAQFLCILSYFLLAQRYAADLYPFLTFCLVIFLGSGGVARYGRAHNRTCRSVIVNCLRFPVVDRS